MSQQFYKPAEACRIAEVAPYVLRYWETEFPVLAQGQKGGTRLYSARDVRIISRIRELLYDEGFTVAGAKKRLEAEISEGRFEDGQKAAPSVAEQKAETAASTSHGIETKAAARAAEPGAPGNPAAKAEAFPQRRRVIEELRDILRILDRSKKP